MRWRYFHCRMEGICMWKRRLCLAAVCLMAISFAGCTRIRITTGFTRSQFANVGGTKTDMQEAYMLLSEEKYTYEKLFNGNVWNELIEGETTEKHVKDDIGETIEQLTILNRMAADMDIVLTDAETTDIENAAEEYYNSLDEDTRKEQWYDKETVESFYTRLRIAEKTFYSVTDNIDTEVSEDEARIINVQYIFVSTAGQNKDGDTTELSQAAVNKKKAFAQSLHDQIIGGADIASLAREYSDDSQYTLELGRGTYDEDFEDAAFRLNMGDISNVVETEYGFYIIKCTNDNVESDFDKRSQEIVLSRRTQAFASYYTDYADNMYTSYNQRFWEDTDMSKVPYGTGKLYEIYNKYFVSTQ